MSRRDAVHGTTARPAITQLFIERTVMNGFNHPQESLRLVHEHQNRLRRDAGRSRLYREAKRLRAYQRTP